jgi:hypothetical protein
LEFLLHGVEDYSFVLLLIIEADAMLPVVNVAEVTRTVVKVELPYPKGGPFVRVEGICLIFTNICQQDLILALTSLMGHF